MEKTSVTTVTQRAREGGRRLPSENKLSRLDNSFNKAGCETGRLCVLVLPEVIQRAREERFMMTPLL